MARRDDRAAFPEHVLRLEAELDRTQMGPDRIRALERQPTEACTELTRLKGSPSTKRKRWILGTALAFVVLSGSLADIQVVTLGSSAQPAPINKDKEPIRTSIFGRVARALRARAIKKIEKIGEPVELESLAAADLRCPREQLSMSSWGEHQNVVRGCGRCAHYATDPGGVFGWGRVLDPAALKYTCGTTP